MRLRSKRSEAGGNSWEDDGEGDYPFSPSSPPQSPFSNDSSLSSFYAPQERFRYSFDGGEPLYLVEEEESANIIEITEDEPEFSGDFRPIKKEVDPEMEEKYRMFQQWLKSQQNSVKNPSNLSEDFKDTRSESSDEEFHELDGDTNGIIGESEGEEIKEEIPVVIAEEPIIVEEEIQEVAVKEEIPETVKETIMESSSPTPPVLGKKSPSHGKGRAPEPPINPLISPPLSADEEDPVKCSDKASSKKSKLIDYIPGILRPDSAAKPSKSTDKAPKETSI